MSVYSIPLYIYLVPSTVCLSSVFYRVSVQIPLVVILLPTFRRSRVSSVTSERSCGLVRTLAPYYPSIRRTFRYSYITSLISERLYGLAHTLAPYYPSVDKLYSDDGNLSP